MKHALLKWGVLLCIILCGQHLRAGEKFSYGPDGRTEFKQANDKILIRFSPGMSLENKLLILKTEPQVIDPEKGDFLPAPDVAVIRINTSSEQETDALLQRLRSKLGVVYANPFLIYTDGTYQGIQDRVLVRLRSDKDFGLLEKTTNEFGAGILEQNQFDPLLYLVQTYPGSAGNALEIANRLAETRRFDYSEPDFLLLLNRFNTNDPNLSLQWSLNNTGSSQQYNGTAGADMQVFDAWSITTGNSSIKVAIIDEGVDLVHPDLAANMLAGYDATGQNSGGAPSGDDAHGTNCAGIVAAVGNNNLGVAGVAYSCKIIPVRIAYSNTSGNWVTSNTWIGNAINWAWQTADADVLSNSWGGGSSSSTINNAISGAVTSGRGGLGAPVLFAAGNDNGANSYPATQSDVISVIAMSMCYQRKSPSSCDGETWWGSNYGTGADVAAPGVKIASTDISGSAGYSSGNYYNTFNGTSSATPNAAGVMALILSAGPGLTAAQARYTLESTCRKVGSYTYNSNVSGQPNGTWSNDLGYGLVSAYDALLTLAPQANWDAGVNAIIAPTESVCSTEINPQISIRNFGANTITSLPVFYQLDSDPVQTYTFSGNLSSNATAVINLPAMSVTPGSHTFTAYTGSPNGQTDENASNNSSNSSFTVATNGVTLTIVLDNYPEETSWTITDGSGGTVAGGGTYGSFADGSTLVLPVCLSDGCFTLNMYDQYGDGICCGYGSGSYALTLDSDGSVLASGGQFGSSESTPFCVQSSPALNAEISSSTDVSCFGGNDGSASASATGGTPPYQYSWSNGSSGASVSGLTAGTYTVNVEDALGATTSAQVTIAQPQALNASTSATNINCNGAANGSIQLSVTGGTSPYSFQWNDGSTSQNRSNLGAGSYSVTVTDANGCSTSAGAVISQPTALNINVTTSNSTCAGLNNGSASAQVSGGTSPYSYSWSNGGSGSSVNNLGSGSYSVTVTDANGCTGVSQFSISAPSSLVLNLTGDSLNCNGNSNGTVQSFVSGGTSPYNYAWSNGATSGVISNLPAGNYSLTVTDANGCTASGSASVYQPEALASSVSSGNINCNGANNGSASITVSGGTLPYSYQWSNGAQTSSISGLSSGTYTIDVTDALGCTTQGQASISEPTAINVEVAGMNVNCFGENSGQAMSQVSGGTQPYSYSWSNGSTSAEALGLAAGNYALTVTDANGCTATSSVLTISQPQAIIISLDPSSAGCAGAANGEVKTAVSGGTPAYSFAWSNGATTQDVNGLVAGNYSLIVTDANGCTEMSSTTIEENSTLSLSLFSTNADCAGGANGTVNAILTGGTSPYNYSWSNGASTSFVGGLTAGTYSLTVTDAVGCSATSEAIVGEPAALAVTGQVSDATCFGSNNGSMSVSVSGGTLPYTYNWYASVAGNTNSAINLAAGQYTVSIVDGNGCSTSYQNSVNEPNELLIDLSAILPDCFGEATGSISANVTGGVAPFSFLWNDGSTSQNRNNLIAGNYAVTVTDGNGCEASASIDITQPTAISIGLSTTDAACNGASDGSASSSVSGGTAPYTYAWSNGASTASVSGLAAGNYSLTVSDVNGCSASSSASIAQPSALVLQTISTDASCGNSDGTASVAVTGGTMPYSYNWSNGSSNASATSLAAGSYSVTVTDANNCDANTSISVSEDCSGGCTYVNIDFNDFESGLGIWNDGGADCYVSTNANYANSGTTSVVIVDNTDQSTLTTNTLDLSLYEEVTIDFSYYCVSMDNANEDFWLQVSMDGGNIFSTVEEWNLTDEFVNNQRYNDQVVLSGPFSSTVQFRFRCDASGNADYVYLDDINLSGCQIQIPASCEDGIQNGDETGVDCGGAFCMPCNTGCVEVTVNENDFEAGWGIWNDGGSDCARINNSTYSGSGSYTIRIRDNSGTASSTFTEELDLTGYEEITISYRFVPVSMENNEDFSFEYSTVNGWITLRNYASNVNMVNNQVYTDQVVISGPFTANTSFRFICDASGNSDWVYIDDVIISGCYNASSARMAENAIPENDSETPKIERLQVSKEASALLFPNPASDKINLLLNNFNSESVEISITDMSGRLVYFTNMDIPETGTPITISSQDFEPGLYNISLSNGFDKVHKRCVITYAN